MKKAEECQEVQRREILGIFVLKPRRKPQDANKQAGTEIQQWLQMWKSMVLIWGKGVEG